MAGCAEVPSQMIPALDAIVGDGGLRAKPFGERGVVVGADDGFEKVLGC